MSQTRQQIVAERQAKVFIMVKRGKKAQLQRDWLTSFKARYPTLPPPTPEYSFHPDRKFRFDFAFVPQKLAIEIIGGTYSNGGHARGPGIGRDIDKYNHAAAMGWHILFFDAPAVRTGKHLNLFMCMIDTGAALGR